MTFCLRRFSEVLTMVSGQICRGCFGRASRASKEWHVMWWDFGSKLAEGTRLSRPHLLAPDINITDIPSTSLSNRIELSHLIKRIVS